MKTLALLILAALLCTGCAIAPPTDPLTQVAIDNRQSMAKLRAAYSDAETAVDQGYLAGILSRANALSLRDEIRQALRPLVEQAAGAVDGDFLATYNKALAALNGVVLKTRAATTQPTTMPIH